MSRRVLPVLVAILAFYSTALAGTSVSDNIEFFRNKMAQIEGKAPQQPAISSEYPDPKCGTPVTVAIAASMHFNPQYAELASILQRPELPDTFGTAHFLLHYATSGSDSIFQPGVDSIPGIPRYATRLSDVFEHVWSIEIDSLGYNQPPSDSGAGGDSRYDVYLQNLGIGYYGFTTPESIPNYGQRAASYIEIENDFRESSNPLYNPGAGGNPLLAAKVTAAHEFFHAVQFSYDQFEFDFINASDPFTYKPWWLEASSTWMEDVVYTDINDYISYLPFFFRYPWIGLGDFAYQGDQIREFHPYASAVWPIFLTEKYNLDVMRQIWTICGQVQGYNALPATNTVLGQFGTTLSNAFVEFEVWNFHTGNPDAGGFADTQHFYREGNLFNDSFGHPITVDTTTFISSLTSQPSYSIANLPNPPEDLAANFIVMRSRTDAPGGVAINFNGSDISTAEWHVGALGYRPGDSRWVDIQVDPHSGSGLGAWPSWNAFAAVILIPTVSGLTPQYTSFTYAGSVAYDPSLTSDTLGGPPNFALGQSYPSPFLIQSYQTLRIPYSLDKLYDANELALWIYDLNGHKVRKIPGNQFLIKFGRNSSGIQWDGKNDNEEYVASGIYIVLLQAGDKTTTGKIAIVNSR